MCYDAVDHELAAKEVGHPNFDNLGGQAMFADCYQLTARFQMDVWFLSVL